MAAERLVVEALVNDDEAAVKLVVLALDMFASPVVLVLVNVAPVAERLVVEAFEIKALVVEDCENEAREVVLLVTVSLVTNALVVDERPNAARVVVPLVTVSLLIKPLAILALIAEKLVVDAVVIQANVE